MTETTIGVQSKAVGDCLLKLAGFLDHLPPAQADELRLLARDLGCAIDSLFSAVVAQHNEYAQTIDACLHDLQLINYDLWATKNERDTLRDRFGDL